MTTGPAAEQAGWRAAAQRPPPGSWRILAPALLVWFCAAISVHAPGRGGACVVAATIVGVAVLIGPRQRWGRWGRRYLLVPCACIMLTGALIEVGQWVRADAELLRTAETGKAASFALALRGFPQGGASADGGGRWVLAGLDSARGEIPAVLWLEGDLPAEDTWAPGTRLVAHGKLVALEAGSQAAYGVRVERVDDVRTGRAGFVTAKIRAHLREAATATPGAELVPGLAVGDTALVDARLERSMRESSLTHLVAVSGANCALLAAAAIAVCARIGLGRRARIVAAGATLAGFVLVVGPDASVQRAAVMATVMLASGFGGKRAVSLPALGAAIIVLLAADPWQALHPGFALSVAATAGILLLAPPLERPLRRALPWARWLTLPIAVATAAQLACGPLLLLLQPGIPAAGILANVLAGPAAPAGTGIGVLALVVLPVLPNAGAALVQLASLPARWISATAEVVAQLPGARWPWPDGWPGAMLLAAVEAALLVAWLIGSRRLAPFRTDRSGRRSPWRRTRRLSVGARMITGLLLGAAAAAFAGPTVVAPFATTVTTPRDWIVVACDVGQGDALLLRDPRTPDRVLVVDTGDDEALLGACLERFGVSRVHLLVLTHDDRDHVGALDALVDRVDRALVGPAAPGDGTGRQILRMLNEAAVPVDVGARGDTGTVGDLDWEVLGPEPGAEPEDTNAASLVLRVTSGGLTVLLLADTGLDEQRRLRWAHGARLDADVVKIAHHGSKDQDPELPSLIGATWAIVSAGEGNGYGHPSPEALAMYESAGALTLRTDLHGAIAIESSGGAASVWVERASPTPRDE